MRTCPKTLHKFCKYFDGSGKLAKDVKQGRYRNVVYGTIQYMVNAWNASHGKKDGLIYLGDIDEIYNAYMDSIK